MRVVRGGRGVGRNDFTSLSSSKEIQIRVSSFFFMIKRQFPSCYYDSANAGNGRSSAVVISYSMKKKKEKRPVKKKKNHQMRVGGGALQSRLD